MTHVRGTVLLQATRERATVLLQSMALPASTDLLMAKRAMASKSFGAFRPTTPKSPTAAAEEVKEEGVRGEEGKEEARGGGGWKDADGRGRVREENGCANRQCAWAGRRGGGRRHHRALAPMERQ